MFKDHIKKLIALALPVAASHVSDMLVSTVDVLMVGPLGATPLAGVQVATSATLIAMLFSIGFSIAITPLAGEAYGKGNLIQVAHYGKAGFAVSMILTTVLCLILLAGSNHMDLLGSQPEVTSQAVPFFRWIVLSFVFRSLFGVFKQTAEAMSNTRAATIINLGVNIINVILCWVFVYGNLGMWAMGAEGAGFATFISRVLAAIAAILVYRYTDFFKSLRLSVQQTPFRTISITVYKKIWHDGAGIGLQILMEVLAFAMGAIMLGWIGAVAVAAHSVAINMASITFMSALGLASAATIRVSNLRGQGLHAEARGAATVSLLMVVVYMLFVGSCYMFFRFWLPSIYVSDVAVIVLAADLLLYAAAFSLFDGLQVVALGILRGYNDVRIPTIVAAVSYLGLTIPAAYTFAFVLGMGPVGIWIGYLLGLVVASAGYVGRYWYVVHSAARQTGTVGYL